MPTQVAAVPGAIVVSFPWAGAASAVAALERAAATLGSQLETQGGLLPDIAGWDGAYRDEFDGTLGRVGGVAGGVRERLTLLASAIVTGAQDANEQQVLNNRHARGA